MAGLLFRPDKTFTIAQFTDLHVTECGDADRKTVDMLGRLLDAERPDLVALTGDVIYGYGAKDPEAAWRMAVAPASERGIPWAAVFGNHDDEGALKRRDLYDLSRTIPGCLTEAGPPHLQGVGNYVLPVASRNGGGAAANLYFIDSGSYARTKEKGTETEYAWITPEQGAWYGTESASRNAGRTALLPGLAFFHIPLPEYNDVWEQRPCRGVKYEDVCCPKHNSGFFAALRGGGDVLGTFVGHDHVNDYAGSLDGIRLCYGRGTGHNTYGRDGFPRGARMIRLREDVRDFETWLRLDDGTVVTEQPLHPPMGRVLSA